MYLGYSRSRSNRFYPFAGHVCRARCRAGNPLRSSLLSRRRDHASVETWRRLHGGSFTKDSGEEDRCKDKG